MYVCTPYVSQHEVLSTYLEPLELVTFELQLCPINHKTCGGSWNFVIITLEDTSTHETIIF